MQTTAPTPPSTAPLVIVGSGIAGYNLAKAYRKLNPERPITIITRDGGEQYYKPAISASLSKNASPDSLVQASAEELRASLQAEILTHTRVEAIDRTAKRLHTDKGPQPYGDLVLAVGADQTHLPIPGAMAHQVLTVNDLDDLRAFVAALPPQGRIAIIGAGLIGCEFANDMLLTGHAADVIDIAATPLARFIPPALGEILKRELEQLGLHWHLGCSLAAIEAGTTKPFCCRLNNGTTIEADLVLSAVGLRPRIALAQAAGIATQRGILVDQYLGTADPHIHALGDCIEFEGQLWPFVMPIMHETRALAATLAGKPTPLVFPVMPIVVKTESCPVIVVPPAPADAAAGAWTAAPAADGPAALFLDREQRLKGFALLGAATIHKARYLRTFGQSPA